MKGWLFMDALGRKDGKLMTSTSMGPTPGILAARLERTIVERQIDIVMLDPFIKTHGLENDNNNIDAVAQILTDVAIKYNIAVDVPHHMAKGAADPGNANKGRGASALKDALRLVRAATAMTPEEAKALGKDEAARRRLIRIDDATLNIAPANEARWFRLTGGRSGNATR
jgi:RecA-family ATPase